MGWKVWLCNICCNIAVTILFILLDLIPENTDMGFWEIFFDFKFNYFIFFIVVNAVFVIVVTSMQKKKYSNEILDNRNAMYVLRDIGRGISDSEISLYSFGKDDYSVVQSNEKWANWINYNKGKNGLVAQVNRSDLDYNDFGNEFHFFDLVSGEIIPIPTGKSAKHDIVSNSFRNGMVLRLIPKDFNY